MNRMIPRALALALMSALALAPSALGEEPVVTPFPAAHSGDVFVAAQTTTTTGAIANWFAPGQTVVFRAYAVDGKTMRLLTPATTRYFNVVIANVGRIPFHYTPTSAGATGRYKWTAQWVVPANYPLGVVSFVAKVRTKHVKRLGSFTQLPISTSQLNISATPPDPGTGPTGAAGGASTKVTMPLYVDTVNSTRPKNAMPRPIGCAQTNVFKRGERPVVRAWGFDLTKGDVFSMDNVTEAHAVVAGMSNIPLNFGAHGPTGAKVWYWTGAFDVAVDYPLGDITLRVVFNLDSGKTATAQYPLTIIP